MDESAETDTSGITDWRSIVTLIVFVLTNIVVLFPFHIPIFVPRPFTNAVLDTLSTLRIVSPRQDLLQPEDDDDQNGKAKPYVRLNFPLNFVTAPLIADLFLLAIMAIGEKEVHDGTIGADNISPYSIMLFFLTLAYIAISIDASGLIRFLAFKVLQKGGGVGHKLFFYLYTFFFVIGSFIGNDPIILSGTAFLAYMTRVSSNIVHPRAWIHSQFAVANIASAILVSSNPTNLVLAGAFNIKFINYTANMVVPVVITAIVLFPFLLYIVFADESLIPLSIKMHELTDEEKAKKPVNPNIPNARGIAEEEENNLADDEQGKLLSLEEIMNPFLDKGGAAFGAVIMFAALATLLALNAIDQKEGEHPVYYVTLPAAFIMLCWDIGFGWHNRRETRDIAHKGRREVEYARAERTIREREARQAALVDGQSSETQSQNQSGACGDIGGAGAEPQHLGCLSPPAPPLLISKNSDSLTPESIAPLKSSNSLLVSEESPNSRSTSAINTTDKKQESDHLASSESPQTLSGTALGEEDEEKRISSERVSREIALQQKKGRPTLVSLAEDAYRWSQETFPTVTAVVAHLPFALVPFAFCMFVLVQALVTKGWVPVFARGWDRWVSKTGTVGSIGGMGFISVILCNFAGTNIGTTILLCRVIQAWQAIETGDAITDRQFWGAVYGMALGVNYGAFSTAFSASLAGLLWRDILARKHINVRRLDFARVNLPIIAIAMGVGCSVLIIEVYIMRTDSPYNI